MIELKEKAKNYAEENVISVLKEAFAKVYADGYRDGYKDCQNEIPADLRNNQTEFVDLGLPSGTMWAADYENMEDGEGKKQVLYLPHGKASQLNIPTKEQWEELISNCRWEGSWSSSAITFYGVYCIGPNGNSIFFRSKGLMKESQISDSPNYGGGKVYFWIHDNEEGLEKKAIKVSGKKYREDVEEIISVFSGYKLPIRLVKAK